MDALSAALSVVRMTGAIFFDAVCTAPWGFKVPSVQQVAHLLAPGTERLVPYHFVAEGEALARYSDGTEIPLAAGDVVIIPRGDAHVVSNGTPAALIDAGASLEKNLAGELSTLRIGGGSGAATRFICGYFGCERHAETLFLAGLPTSIKVNLRGDPAGAWIETSIRHLLGEAGSNRPGRAALLSKMAEALFIEILRRYMEQLPQDETGWLAAARDPIVGRAMALLHERPAEDWSMEKLATEVGASRSVLAERFACLLGQPPMAYLARCRLQRAAHLLQATHRSIVQTALEVGYESEAAFNRAFKREFSVPPARYRRLMARREMAVKDIPPPSAAEI
jgi:AraC-like DNA-binding protein